VHSTAIVEIMNLSCKLFNRKIISCSIHWVFWF